MLSKNESNTIQRGIFKLLYCDALSLSSLFFDVIQSSHNHERKIFIAKIHYSRRFDHFSKKKFSELASKSMSKLHLNPENRAR